MIATQLTHQLWGIILVRYYLFDSHVYNNPPNSRIDFAPENIEVLTGCLQYLNGGD